MIRRKMETKAVENCLKRQNDDTTTEESKDTKKIMTENNNSEVVKDINKKREDYLHWDDYFMAIAFLSAQRSKDPSTQVGACIVNDEKKIVGIGYNGMPNGCSDDVVPWNKQSSNRLETKYPYVVHAELNAILNKNAADVKNCSIYVALFPCNECAKVIIQSGIKEVIFFSDKYHHSVDMEASRKLFDWAGVKYKKFVPVQKKITIDFDDLNETFPSKDAPGKLEAADEPLFETNKKYRPVGRAEPLTQYPDQ